MVSSDFAKEQLKRLRGLNFFPLETSALRELALAIESAKNEGQARELIDSLLAETTDAPKPAEIRRALSSMATARVWRAGSDRTNCTRCEGTGWVHGTRKERGTSYAFAERCECNGGPMADSTDQPSVR